MGRPRTTDEQRLARVSELDRLALLDARNEWERAKRELEFTRGAFREAAQKALAAGAGIRDLGVILGMNHQTVQELVKPHKKTS